MSALSGLWIAVGALLLYLAAVLALGVAGRRTDARALAGFIPDCVVLFERLLSQAAVLRWRRGLLVAALAYLAMPLDIVPDFIPVLGQLDDLLIAGIAVWWFLRVCPPEVALEEVARLERVPLGRADRLLPWVVASIVAVLTLVGLVWLAR